MSVARTGLPHTDRTPAAEDRSSDRGMCILACAERQRGRDRKPVSGTTRVGASLARAGGHRNVRVGDRFGRQHRAP